MLFLMTKIELSKKLKKDSANHSAMIVTNGQHFYQMVDCLCAIIKLPMQREDTTCWLVERPEMKRNLRPETDTSQTLESGTTVRHGTVYKKIETS